MNRQPAVAFYLWQEQAGAYLPLTIDVLRIIDGAIAEIITPTSSRGSICRSAFLSTARSSTAATPAVTTSQWRRRRGSVALQRTPSGTLDFVPGTPTLAPPKPTRLRSEIVVFGLVGLAGFITDVGVFNLLRYAGEPAVLEHKPLTAKIASVAVAMLVTYLGNRHWTWRGRSRDKLHHEVVLFVAFNLIGMGIAVACLGFSHYVLGLTSPLADNVSANGVGLVLGTIFRFWAYRTHVFRDESTTAP